MPSYIIKKPKNKLNWEIAELELSVSAYKALRKKGIETIRDLLTFTERNNWASAKYPLGICRSKEIAAALGAWHLADTQTLLSRAGYPMRYYQREPVYLSRMALAMPHEHLQGELT